MAWYCRDLGPQIRLLVERRTGWRGLAGDRLLGATILLPRPHEACAWLELIAVAPDQQGQGSGRRLLELAESAATAAGFDRLEFMVAADNHGAMRFYERLGYRRVAGRVQGPNGWRYSKELHPTTHDSPAMAMGLEPNLLPGPVGRLANRVLFRLLVPR